MVMKAAHQWLEPTKYKRELQCSTSVIGANHQSDFTDTPVKTIFCLRLEGVTGRGMFTLVFPNGCIYCWNLLHQFEANYDYYENLNN